MNGSLRLRVALALVVNFLWLGNALAAPGLRSTPLRSASGKPVTGSRFAQAAAALTAQSAVAGLRPAVRAGSRQAVPLGTLARLSGSAVSGTPGTPVTSSWKKLSGPGTVTFGDATASKTVAAFSAPGTYVLELAAAEGAQTSTDTVEITVQDTAPVAASLAMTSDAGDYIGQGQTYSYTNVAGSFGVSAEYSGNILVSYMNGTDNWSLEFGGPVFGPLQPGTYTGATRAAFRTATQPGLDVYGEGRGSNTLTGSFVIKKIIYGPGNTIVSFWATFEQHSEGAAPALRGEIQYNIASTATSVNQAPTTYAGAAQSVAFPAVVSLSGLAQDGGQPAGAPLATTWSVSSGPGTVTFNPATALQTTASFSAPGTYVLQLTASDGQLSGSSTVTITVVDPSVQTSLVMTSDSGDYIGGGQDYSFSPLTGSFTLSSGPGTADLSYSDASGQWWYLDFATPDGAPFAVGTYSGAARAAFKDPAQPGLEVFGDGRGSNTVTGTFTVKKAVYGAGNNLVSFWAIFEQHSEGSVPALRGEIKYNAQDTDPSINQAPGVYAGPAARIVLPNALGLAGSAGDDGLPNNILNTTWSVVSGPGTVTFGNPAALQTTATFSAAGNYVLQLAASDGALSATSTVNVEVVDASVNTSLTMTSDPGDYIGQGQAYSYSLVTGDFTATYSGGVMNIDYSAGEDDWSLSFAAPNGGALTDGTYNGAARYPFESANQPGLSVYGEGRGSNTLTGSFTVNQIVIAPNGSVTSFWATFIQHSEGATPALHGEIKINAGGATGVNQPPIVNAGASTSTLLANALPLSGTATDDGLPNNTLTTTWSLVSGPATVTFGNAAALQTTALFSAAGSYILALTASDGQLSATSDLAVVVIDPNNPTSLTMTSDAGDYLGQGQNYNFDLTTGAFSSSYSAGGAVSFTYSGGGEMWTLDFEAPNGAPLVPGTYSGAARYPFQSASQPGMDVYGDGRGSNTLTGSFVVNKVIYGPNNQMTSFWATFILHSEGGTPALHGELKFNAGAGGSSVNQPPGVSAGASANVTATLGQPLALAGTATDDGLPNGTLTTTWSETSGPGTATFGNAAALQTTATFSAAGQYVLQLTANDGQLSATSSLNVNVVDPNDHTSLNMVSAPGDYIGEGATYSFTPYDGIFTVTGGSEGVHVVFNTPDYSEFWYLDFVSPNGATLAPGIYTGAARYPFQAANQPGLSVDGDGRGSDTLTGSFTVNEIAFNPDGSVARFSVTFIQHSDGETPALTGSFLYHATAAVSPAPVAPVADAGADTGGLARVTIPLSGSATVNGLPAGSDVTYAWSEISGTGAVVFANRTQPVTTAIFPAGGTYVLQLMASNAQGSSFSKVTVSVTPITGTRQGILLSRDGSPVGQITLQTTLTGAFTGKVTIGGKSYSFAGFLDGNDQWDGNGASVKGAPTLTLEVAPDGSVEVTAIYDGQALTATATQVLLTAGAGQFPQGYAGVYAARFAPAVDANLPAAEPGWAMITVSRLGTAVCKGVAPDGTSFSAVAKVSADGQILVAGYLEADQTNLAGLIQLPTAPQTAVTGTLYWGEPLNLLSPVASRTNNAPLALSGALNVPLGARAEPLTGSQSAVAAQLAFTGLGAQTPALVPITLTGRTSTQPPAPAIQVSLRTTVAGVLTGEFKDPRTKKRISFSGIVLEAEGVGIATFNEVGNPGWIQLQVAPTRQ